jgi:hypothetical protein
MTVSHTRFLTAAAATVLTVLLTSPASAQVARFDHDLSLGNQAVSEVRYYRGGYRAGYRGGYRRYGYRGYGYRRYGYRGYGYRGAAVAAGAAAIGAGAAGLAVGAIGGAVAAQGTPGYSYGGTQVTDADAYACRNRFSNWDPATRLGLGTDGIWYFCPSYGGGYTAAQAAQ